MRSGARIVELEVTGGSRFILPGASKEAVRGTDWLHPHFIDPDGQPLPHAS